MPLGTPHNKRYSLRPPRRRKLAVPRSLNRRPIHPIRMDLIQLPLKLRALLRARPYIVPVLLARSRSPGPHGFKDVLRWIGVLPTRARTILLKIVDERARVLPDIAEVDGLAALAQEEQPVEDLEQLRGRLVDGA